MTVGIAMLVHNDLDRAAQIARHWVAGGCSLVIHVDKKVPGPVYSEFVKGLSDVPEIKFSKRFKCEWGMWGLVAATQAACELLLASFPDVRHVYLSSGACLPLRPVQELIDYLDANPETDFIESVTTDDASWIVDGLEDERFTLRFPFSWRKQRRLFDKYVDLQRKYKVKRKIPGGLVPHIGSQWWCLTRQTLTAILQDPLRTTYDRYFKRVWIPDESYFQTMARRYSRKLQSRSLTLAKFDFQGKPHIFYDDHLQLLRRSDCFVARKIWPQADRLYAAFLRTPETALKQAEPQPGKIDRLFVKATERRIRGRAGLSMQSRFPNEGWENGLTYGPYSVLEGFDELFEDFVPWLSRTIEANVHGHLFAPERVEYAHGGTSYRGAMSDSAKIRDYNGYSFLRNLIWNSRGEHQVFQFGPFDTNTVHWEFVKDRNANVAIISGAWLLRHFKSNSNFADIRKDAAKRQRIEREHINAMKSPYVKAKCHIWTFAEFLEAPVENLRLVLEDISPGIGNSITEAPKMTDLTGFGTFLRSLKDQGMSPYLLGDYREETGDAHPNPSAPRKPYLVR